MVSRANVANNNFGLYHVGDRQPQASNMQIDAIIEEFQQHVREYYNGNNAIDNDEPPAIRFVIDYLCKLVNGNDDDENLDLDMNIPLGDVANNFRNVLEGFNRDDLPMQSLNDLLAWLRDQQYMQDTNTNSWSIQRIVNKGQSTQQLMQQSEQPPKSKTDQYTPKWTKQHRKLLEGVGEEKKEGKQISSRHSYFDTIFNKETSLNTTKIADDFYDYKIILSDPDIQLTKHHIVPCRLLLDFTKKMFCSSVDLTVQKVWDNFIRSTRLSENLTKSGIENCQIIDYAFSAIIWMPGNLVLGPESSRRSDDPGSAFDNVTFSKIQDPTIKQAIENIWGIIRSNIDSETISTNDIKEFLTLCTELTRHYHMVTWRKYSTDPTKPPKFRVVDRAASLVELNNLKVNKIIEVNCTKGSATLRQTKSRK